MLKNILSSGLSEIISSTGSAIDKLVTSEKERGDLKVEMKKQLNQFEQSQLDAIANYDREVTNRHTADMKSDSFLSKNIRPMALIFLTVSTVLLAFLTIFILDENKVKLIEPWVALLQLLLITTYAFYFGSRGFEKVQAIKGLQKKNDNNI